MFEDVIEGGPVGEIVIIESLEDVEFTLGSVFLINGGPTSVSGSGNNALVQISLLWVRRTFKDSMVMVLVWKE